MRLRMPGPLVPLLILVCVFVFSERVAECSDDINNSQCLAKLLCVSSASGGNHEQQADIIAKFFQDVTDPQEPLSESEQLHDYVISAEELQPQLMTKQSRRKNERIARAMSTMRDYTSKTKIGDCQQIAGCPYSVQQLVSRYGINAVIKSISANTIQPHNLDEQDFYDDAGIGVTGHDQDPAYYSDDEAEEQQQAGAKTKGDTGSAAVTRAKQSVWDLQPRRPPPPPFWEVKTPESFWEASGGGGCGRGKKGKGKGKCKGKGKGKGGKGWGKGKGKKGKGKGKKGGNQATSSEEERTFHRRLHYFLREQKWINAHKAALSMRIGGRPMYVNEYKDVPISMSSRSPSHADFSRPLRTAFSTISRLVGNGWQTSGHYIPY